MVIKLYGLQKLFLRQSYLRATERVVVRITMKLIACLLLCLIVVS